MQIAYSNSEVKLNIKQNYFRRGKLKVAFKKTKINVLSFEF